MKKLMEILMELDDSIDWENETALIDERILDSFGVISLISELEEQFDIEIEASEIIPQNLNSADAMWKMIQRLQENYIILLYIWYCFCHFPFWHIR